MAKFTKKKGGGSQQLSTASLPDIVFMLLFFFMVSTTMREVTLKINVKMPSATEVKKLEKKSLVSYIYIGKPLPAFQGIFGTEPKLQLNDQLSDVEDIAEYVEREREERNEMDRPFITTSLKVDNDTKMGVVTDVKIALREVQALKINYSAKKKYEKK